MADNEKNGNMHMALLFRIENVSFVPINVVTEVVASPHVVAPRALTPPAIDTPNPQLPRAQFPRKDIQKLINKSYTPDK